MNAYVFTHWGPRSEEAPYVQNVHILWGNINYESDTHALTGIISI